MKYGISVPNMADPSALVDLAVAAEAAGWDGFFVWDHVQWRRDAGNDIHDPWVLLGAMATRTSAVALGPLVTPVARRRPQKLAKEVITLDHLSGGRAVLGVGLGAPAEDEFANFGDAADDRVRAARLDEGLAVLDALLRGEGPLVHHGEHFDVDADLRPGALQRPRPPIWVAGVWPSRRPWARAARWEGVVPIAANQTGLRPDEIAEIVEACGGSRDGFDVVVHGYDQDPDELASAGATWIIESRWPVDDWMPGLRDDVTAGPPR